MSKKFDFAQSKEWQIMRIGRRLLLLFSKGGIACGAWPVSPFLPRAHFAPRVSRTGQFHKAVSRIAWLSYDTPMIDPFAKNKLDFTHTPFFVHFWRVN